MSEGGTLCQLKHLINTTNIPEKPGGTLCQLKHLINTTNIPEKPKRNVHATEELVVIGHFIAAALHHFKMNTIQDSPSSTFLDHYVSERTF